MPYTSQNHAYGPTPGRPDGSSEATPYPPTRSRIEQAEGRKRVWTAPNGMTVVLPLRILAWEDHPITGERSWTASAVVDLLGGKPWLTSLELHADDGMQEERLQNEFRWSTPREIVTHWIPEQLALGNDPLALEPPTKWWLVEGRYNLTDEFLGQVAKDYLRYGRGYAKAMASDYATTERTIRSWVQKARERGILGSSLGPGKHGSADK